MTVDEFLEWERRQELRYEFDGFAPSAMTGGTLNHSAIATRLANLLENRLSNQCRVYRGDVKILVAGRVRYPDAAVTCSPIDGQSDILPSPVVVFEVLSASTAAMDRVTKNAEYAATASIQRYVMLEQVRVGATVFARDGSNWVGTVLLDDAVLAMPEIGVELRLKDLYANIELPSPETDD
ncbi:Uma2 family endonuclease [Rhodopila sp.]|uniref:Uma2 family endonuclease n=1 Tax=Rhodopila sp. TaxID=2480087 RepID=UPI003D109BED